MTDIYKNKRGATVRHGFARVGKRHPFYNIWSAMRQRCRDTNQANYKIYGGRGITVCKEWNKFENFFNDMFDSYFEHASIERKDNNGNYEKNNCKWITVSEQAKNRRNNNIIEFNGIRKTKMDWARFYKIGRGALYWRLRYGMSFEEAINKPYKKIYDQ